MRYCQNCVLPDTRPNIRIEADGICNACHASREKQEVIDWAARQQEFETLLADIRTHGMDYDCIVPVSGGKDSTAQVVKCLEYGLRVLAVTWRTPARTLLGQQNLENLMRLGVDHIDYTINPEIERRFMLKTLVQKGDTAIPMHLALFSIPLRLAVQMRIPLVLWGESPHMEYGGTADERRRNMLDLHWLKTHGILHGTSAEDWLGGDLSPQDLAAYRLPAEATFASSGVHSVFMGYFFPWDPEISLKTALAHGFQVRQEGAKVGYYNYADIDCDFISVHHHFKWLKFGITRLFDNLALEIRAGRMTRAEAIQIIRERGDQTPHEDIAKLCDFLQITPARYREIEESFRNQTVWQFVDGSWQIPDFLISDWKWA